MSKDFPVIIQQLDPVEEIKRNFENFKQQKNIECKWVKNNYSDDLPEGFKTCAEYHEAIRESERDMMIEVLEELFNQHCLLKSPTGEPYYDHMCNSSFEDAQKILIQFGRIKKEECIR